MNRLIATLTLAVPLLVCSCSSTNSKMDGPLPNAAADYKVCRATLKSVDRIAGNSDYAVCFCGQVAARIDSEKASHNCLTVHSEELRDLYLGVKKP